MSFLQCCHTKRYNKIFTKMWVVYSLLWDTVHTTYAKCSGLQFLEPIKFLLQWKLSNYPQLFHVKYFSFSYATLHICKQSDACYASSSIHILSYYHQPIRCTSLTGFCSSANQMFHYMSSANQKLPVFRQFIGIYIKMFCFYLLNRHTHLLVSPYVSACDHSAVN